MEQNAIVIRRVTTRTASAASSTFTTRRKLSPAYNELATFQQNSTFSTWIHRIAIDTESDLAERRTRSLLITESFTHDSVASRVPSQIRRSSSQLELIQDKAATDYMLEVSE